jgi:CubicO group peptidase (beta-lactamase class C family)
MLLAPGTARAQIHIVDPVELEVAVEENTFFAAHPSYKPTAMMVVVASGNGARTSYYGYNCTSSQLFGIGSNTKTFTAMLAAMQDQEGGMTLDSTLASWVSDSTCTYHTVCVDPGICIPEPSCTVPWENSATITLRDLADHFSGLPKNPPHPDETSKEALYSDVFTGVDGYGEGDQTPQAPLGEGHYNYSNWGFAVLGNVLADYHYGHIGTESGPAYWRSLLAERITGPLAMTQTVGGAPQNEPPAGAIGGLDCTGNNGVSGEPFSCQPTTGSLWCFDDSTGWAAGGMWMDAVDVGTWLNVNLGNWNVVNAPAEMRTAVTGYLHTYRHPDSGQGLAWAFDSTGTIKSTAGNAMTAMWKDGDSPGFHSYVVMTPGDINGGAPNRAVAIMVNFDSNPDQTTITTQVDDIADRVLQDLVTEGL